MKPIGVFYATREGQTRRIAEHVAEAMRARGLAASAIHVTDFDLVASLDAYAALVLAASVHAGRHESEMIAFVKRHRAALDTMPAAFISVTLSEAGAEDPRRAPEERARFAADVDKMLEAFFDETGWHPARTKPVAGALMYTQYNVLERFIMKRIARHVGAETDTSRDHEYTDWIALDQFVDELASAWRN